MFTLRESVGLNCTNNEDDVKNVIKYLDIRKNQSLLKSVLADMILPGAKPGNQTEQLVAAIKLFQKNVQKLNAPDGKISNVGNTILFLGGVRSSGKQIIVDLDDQNLYAYDGGKLIYEYSCTSGDSGHPTAVWPSLHSISRKHEKYRSRTYDAQMDYAMFFTNDGKAIHQSSAVTVTSILKDWGFSGIGSHGCVRLSESNAKELFKWAPMNTPVFIDMEMP